jgi:ketosteroid isomerase-like protein
MVNIHRALLVALLVVMLLPHDPLHADEAAVRTATEALVGAWNRHDVKAWSAHLTDDVWYTETEDFYERFKGRDKVVGWFSYNVENSDLQWEIVRMRTRPDGLVSVVLVQRMSMLPRTHGKYASVFTSDPSIARWRRDGDGRWRVAFFTSHKGWALAEMKKDDEAFEVAAAAVPATAASVAAPPRATTGSEPWQYTELWSSRAQACSYCHGRPPSLPSSEISSRIVAVGAAAIDGAGLRAAMQRQGLGGVMDRLLAEPALTDASLEAVRRYLIDVRDGFTPDRLAFDAPGATRELVLRNERSLRDVPAAIALMRVSGPFVIDTERSTCRSGATLAGQSSCTVVLRAAPSAAAGTTGAAELQLAPTPGLEPALRRTVLHVGG